MAYLVDRTHLLDLIRAHFHKRSGIVVKRSKQMSRYFGFYMNCIYDPVIKWLKEGRIA